jgi:hypothetical protein
MAVKKKVKLPRRPSPIVPDATAQAVESVIGQKGSTRGVQRKSVVEKMRERMHMTPGERKRIERDEKRIRLYADVSPEIRSSIIELAKPKRVSLSSLTALMVAVGLQAVQSGKLDIDNYLRPSKTPRFDYEIDVDAWKKDQKVEE